MILDAFKLLARWGSPRSPTGWHGNSKTPAELRILFTESPEPPQHGPMSPPGHKPKEPSLQNPEAPLRGDSKPCPDANPDQEDHPDAVQGEPAPEDHSRPPPLRGLRALISGGLVLAGLLAVLNPITSMEDCPNDGGNDSASILTHETWKLLLPPVLLLWVLAALAEQFLPVTRRDWADTILRATAAVSLTVVGSCYIGWLMITCR